MHNNGMTPQSETTLFEDMEFTSNYNNTSTDRTTAKRTLTQTVEKMKGAAKKPKVEKEPDEAACLGADVKPITEKEKGVLETSKIVVKELSDKVEENHTTLKDEKLKDLCRRTCSRNLSKYSLRPPPSKLMSLSSWKAGLAISRR